MDLAAQQDLLVAGRAGAGAHIGLGAVRRTHYRMECHGRDGKLKWVDEFDNLVTTEGLNDALDKHLKGAAYTAAWYVGLTDGTPDVVLADIMSSHAGWVEVTAYDEAVRQTLVLGTPSGGSVSNTASKAVFTVSANGTVIGGAFVVSVSTKGGTTGVLYGGGAMAEGDRTLADGDTLTVTVTLTTANPA